MKLLNRSALVVRPRQPFVDWVGTLDSEHSGLDEPLTLAQHREEGRVYLVAERELVDLKGALEEHYLELFENELAAWDELALCWPESLSLVLFLDWFEVEPLLLAFDLAEQPLMMAELEV